jgi:predicted nucleic acid-binding Zn ribbon protein
MADQPERIPQHRHCRNCGKAFVGEGHFCEDGCKDTAGTDAKKKLRKLAIIWLAIVAATIVIIILFSPAL